MVRCMTELYLISPKIGLEPAPVWWSEYLARLPVCGACKLMVPPELRRSGVAVCIRGEPGNVPLAQVTPPSVHIVRRDLIDLFAREAAQYLKLGPVSSEDGKHLGAWQSVTTEKPLLIRGGPQSVRCTCPSCGRLRYQAAGRDDEFCILADDLTGQPIYEASGWGLVMTADLWNRVEKGRWKGIWVTRLPVRDEPLDGLPGIIPNLSY